MEETIVFTAKVKGSKEMINRFVASVEKLCEATAEVKDLSEKFEK